MALVLVDMKRISSSLVASLKTLGLFESEAKVYAALVLSKYAEAKDIVKFLDVSKPSVYESLRTLQERGLVVETNSKPLVYQAIPPEIAVRLLADVYVKASEEAIKGLHALEKEGFRGKSSQALWSIYGIETVGYKISDMIEHAEKSVYCTASDRYLHYIEQAAGRGLKVTLAVMSDDGTLEGMLKRSFEKDDATIHVMSAKDMTNDFSAYEMGSDREVTPFKEAMSMLDHNNAFMLIVDDREFLYIPPIAGDEVSALNTTNPTFIMSSKYLFSTWGKDRQPGRPAR